MLISPGSEDEDFSDEDLLDLQNFFSSLLPNPVSYDRSYAVNNLRLLITNLS